MKKAVRRTMIYGILAVFLFGALFLATFRSRRSQAKENAVQIVVFGDSVMGLVRDETAVPARLQALTGKTVFNAALGGTCAARSRNDRGMDLTMGSLSLVGLTRAVWAEDFSVQDTGRQYRIFCGNYRRPGEDGFFPGRDYHNTAGTERLPFRYAD